MSAMPQLFISRAEARKVALSLTCDTIKPLVRPYPVKDASFSDAQKVYVVVADTDRQIVTLCVGGWKVIK